MTDHQNCSAESIVEPLPCPFCGTAPKVISGGAGTRIQCPGEECFGPSTTADWLDDAVFQWNKRMPTDAQPVSEPSEENIAVALFEARHHGLTNIMPWDDIDHDGRDYWRTIARNLMRTHRVVPVSHSSAGTGGELSAKQRASKTLFGDPSWLERPDMAEQMDDEFVEDDGSRSRRVTPNQLIAELSSTLTRPEHS